MKEVTIQDAIEMEEFMRPIQVNDWVEILGGDEASPFVCQRGRVTRTYKGGWVTVFFSGYKTNVKGFVSFRGEQVVKINVS